MPDPLDPGAPGDISPFLKSFSTVNTAMDLLRQQRANQRGMTGGSSLVVPDLRPSLRVWVQNSSGGILAPGSVVKLGAAVTGFTGDDQYEFRKLPWFIGTTPGATTDAFAILEDPIDYPGGGNFAHGRGVIQGMAVCDVDITDAGHGYATPTVGDATKLTSAASGPARIIDRESSGAGVKRCSVKLDESAAGSGAITVSAWKEPVRVATTATGTLSTAYENGDTVDGVTLVTGDRILLKNQSTGTENGIYTVNASGAPTRATDADAGSELVGAVVYVSEGTANADTIWACTNNAAITLGATALAFALVAPYVSPIAASGGYYPAGSPTSITADDTPQDMGATITLPSAGTYLVWANTIAVLNVSATGGGIGLNLAQIVSNIHNDTAGAYITGVSIISGHVPVINVSTQTSAGQQFILTVAGSTSLTLYSLRRGGPTWVTSNVLPSMGYVKLTD